jgi:hypothetical protein
MLELFLSFKPYHSSKPDVKKEPVLIFKKLENND